LIVLLRAHIGIAVVLKAQNLRIKAKLELIIAWTGTGAALTKMLTGPMVQYMENL